MHNSDMYTPISKELTAASASSLILSILCGGDSYGYAIIKRVRDLSGGALEWTEGMLYPVLHRLEEQGAVSSYWAGAEGSRRRKYYSVTESGRGLLETQMNQWKLVDAALRNSISEGVNGV